MKTYEILKKNCQKTFYPFGKKNVFIYFENLFISPVKFEAKGGVALPPAPPSGTAPMDPARFWIEVN